MPATVEAHSGTLLLQGPALIGPGWQDLDLVCERGDGGPLHPDSWTKAFKRLARQAGLPRATRLHDVRHGFATVLLARGVHPAIAPPPSVTPPRPSR